MYLPSGDIATDMTDDEDVAIGPVTTFSDFRSQTQMVASFEPETRRVQSEEMAVQVTVLVSWFSSDGEVEKRDGLNGTTLIEDDLAMGGVSKFSTRVGVVVKDPPLKTSAMGLSAVDPGLSCARSGKRS